MYLKKDDLDEKATLIRTIQMLGIDPMSMGPRCYQIMRSDLKDRICTKGLQRTLQQVIKARAHRKYSDSNDCHTLYPDYE